MPGFREKITPFTFGLSIGLLIACLFFIFKLDSYLRKIELPTLAGTNKVSEQVVEPKEEKQKQERKKEEKISRRTEAEESKRGNNNSFVSMNNVSDSAFDNSETYKVLKEELQSVKNIYVKTLTPKERTNAKDSLAASLAGVTKPAEPEFFMIEFWRTPLNSKGYKMTRSRLIIYGFKEGEDLLMVKDADKYYLRNNKMVYALSYSAEFRPMERADEAEIQGKFN